MDALQQNSGCYLLYKYKITDKTGPVKEGNEILWALQIRKIKAVQYAIIRVCCPKRYPVIKKENSCKIGMTMQNEKATTDNRKINESYVYKICTVFRMVQRVKYSGFCEKHRRCN